MKHQFFEKAVALDYIKEKYKIEKKYKALSKQYGNSVTSIKEELDTVETLYIQKEELHKDFRGLFKYIPKKLTETFIKKYQESYELSKDDIEKDIISDLQILKEDLKKLKLNRKSVKDFTELVKRDQELQEIKLLAGDNNKLKKLLQYGTKGVKKSDGSIKNAIKLFNLGKSESLTTLKDVITQHEKDFKKLTILIKQLKNKEEIFDKIQHFKELTDCDSDKLELIIEKIENIVGSLPPNDKKVQKRLETAKNKVPELYKHLEKAYPYTIDPEYLNSLQTQDFLVQTNVHKKISRNMMKSSLLLSSGGYKKITINIPPGINTTLKIYPTGSTTYHVGEFGNYKNISIVDFHTLKTLPYNFSSSDCPKEIKEFKYLYQVEAIRNCSALLTNAMFFELAEAQFIPYINQEPQQAYHFDNIKAQMPMAMKDAVPSTVYLDQEIAKTGLLPQQLMYDYRQKGKKNKGILPDKNNTILFDWLCYKLSASDNDTKKLFYIEFDKEIDIPKKFTNQGWEVSTKNPAKLKKPSEENFGNEYELITNNITTNEGKTVIISEIQKFPLTVFADLFKNWYEVELSDLVEGNSQDIILYGNLSTDTNDM